MYLFFCDSVFFNNTSPGGTLGASFIPQNFIGHNQFLNNTGPGLRVCINVFVCCNLRLHVCEVIFVPVKLLASIKSHTHVQ